MEILELSPLRLVGPHNTKLLIVFMMKWLIDLMMRVFVEIQSEPLPREPGNGPVPLCPDQQRLCMEGGGVVQYTQCSGV